MRKLLLIFFTLPCFNAAIAQVMTIEGTATNSSYGMLAEKFFRYKSFILKDVTVDNKRDIKHLSLQLAGFSQIYSVSHNTDLTDNTLLRVVSGTATTETYIDLAHLNGWSAKGEPCRISIGQQFVMGSFTINGTEYFIEQVRHFVPYAPANEIIIYTAGDVKPVGVSCGTDAAGPASRFSKQQQGKPAGICRAIDLALSIDYSCFAYHGSIEATANYVAGVINLVEGNYTNDFTDEMRYKISEMIVFTTANGNTWQSTGDINMNLSTFSGWANNGFTRSFDLAEHWFNISSSTTNVVGLAYLYSTCNHYGNNVIREYGTSLNNMRNLVAHEIGHNFSAGHDASGSPYIMAPVINGSSTWSTASISSINSYLAGASTACMSACSYTPCETTLVKDVVITYDSVANKIKLTWTTDSVSTYVIRYKGYGGTMDSVSISSPVNHYELSPSCNYQRYRVEIYRLCGTNPSTTLSTDLVPVSAKSQINYDSDHYICPGTTRTLRSVYRYGTYSFQWIRNDTALTGETKDSLLINTGGRYILLVNNGNGCWIMSDTLIITAINAPVVKFNWKNTDLYKIQFDNQTLHGNTYSWNFGDSTTYLGLSPPVHDYKKSGRFIVKLSSDGCSGSALYTDTILNVVDEYNHTNFGTPSGIVDGYKDCIDVGNFDQPSQSQMLYRVKDKFPNEGTIEWQVYLEKGYNENMPADTSTIHLCGTDYTTANPGMFTLWISGMGTVNPAIGLYFNSTTTGYNQWLQAQLDSININFNRWVTIGVSYGISDSIKLAVNGRVISWNIRSNLGGMSNNLGGQPINVATGRHYSSRVSSYVGFKGMVDKIRIASNQANWVISKAAPVLVIPPAAIDTVVVTGCDSATYNGISYSSNASVADTLINTGGCDSIYRLVNIVVDTLVTASVSIISSVNNVPAGTPVTFTAVPVNAGTSPAYQWMRNGTDIPGATSANYLTDLLLDNDTISCRLTLTGCVTDTTVVSNSIVAIIQSTLPVTITSFSATASCNAILLSWQTATEVNNKGFEIQQIISDNTFQTIGFIGAGNSSGKYTFNVRPIKNDKNYFRLKQVDDLGKYTYSKVISVNQDCATRTIGIFPNPAKNLLYIKGLAAGERYALKIINSTGSTVFGTENSWGNRVNVSGFAAGVYLLRINQETLKFVKQ